MKLANIFNKIVLTEALPLSKAKELASIKRNPNIEERLNLIFDKLKNSTKTQSSKRGDRIYIPFNQSNESQFTYDSEITNYLESNGYKVKDYKTGLCLDKYGRELKIGKVLSKLGNQELLQKFNTDKGRESKNNVNSYMVFSKHSYDIGGSSTDRGWTSCMNLFTGVNKSYILEDVKEGSFIVYLISANDMNIQKPIARILVKPYVDINDENNVLYSPTQKIYGTAPDNFLDSVNKILESIQKEKVGLFKFIETLYKDSSSDQVSIYKGELPENNRESLEEFCNKVFGTKLKWSINDNLEIDITGKIDIQEYSMLVKNGKFIVKFGKVTGDFDCPSMGLVSLEGVPKEVGDDFYVSRNQLTSLKYGPISVGRDFYCADNKLTSLKYVPKKINGQFNCAVNNLTTLKYGPTNVTGDYQCDKNQLKTLEGAPKKLGGEIYCSNNPDLPQEEVYNYRQSQRR